MRNFSASPHASAITVRQPSSCSGEHFADFFAGESDRTYDRTGLIDARARAIFELMGVACREGLYPYQIAMDHRSGPRVRVEGEEYLLLSSYDYLGLIGHPRIEAAAIEAIQAYGTGTGGVRMLSGTVDLHRRMERRLAGFLGISDAITFSSGYLANLSVIAALLTPQDLVLMDAYSHRSLLDACRLAQVPVQRFGHNDPDSLREELKRRGPARRTLIIVDGVYSMDGDICPLPELVALKKEFGCYLMVDESHALGVLGAHGRGTHEHFGVTPDEVDIWTGSLAKAIPSNGGFAAVTRELAIYLQHAAPPFIFSAALCPSAVAAIEASLEVLEAESGRLQCMHRNAQVLREGLRGMGFNVGLSETPIIPVIMGTDVKTGTLCGELRKLGVLTTPVMFPAVPRESCRLRLCATAAHSPGDLSEALSAFRALRSFVAN